MDEKKTIEKISKQEFAIKLKHPNTKGDKEFNLTFKVEYLCNLKTVNAYLDHIGMIR